MASIVTSKERRTTMTKNVNIVKNYVNTLYKFRRKLRATLQEGGNVVNLGDKEIEVSQRIADNLRSEDSLLNNQQKEAVTKAHHDFVKWVWTM